MIEFLRSAKNARVEGIAVAMESALIIVPVPVLLVGEGLVVMGVLTGTTPVAGTAGAVQVITHTYENVTVLISCTVDMILYSPL